MDHEKERAKLLERDVQWAALASEGQDVDAILAYWTNDGVVIPPDLPVVVGQAALREYVEQSLQIPGFRISWSSSDVSFSPDGQLAYLVGNNSVTLDGPDGNPIHSTGRVITIWRKEEDDVWRCCVDIWNSGPAA